MKLTLVNQDLFSVDETWALAHCISACCKMGAGIAVEFDKRFPDMRQTLLEKQPKAPVTLPYHGRDVKSGFERTVYNLITKPLYWHKPTYETVERTLVEMRNDLVVNKIKRLAMPKIAAGLDRLSWPRVRNIIEAVFDEVDVEIMICYI